MNPADVSLVIPGRNANETLHACLASVCPMLERGELREILFVDDGSTDNTRDIAAQYPITIINGLGEGPGAARNLGITKAQGEWIWFIDADCVVEPNALSQLLKHTNKPGLAAIGGSYGNMRPESLLASLIHEEIVARHARMPFEVNFLASFNLLFRHDVLNHIGIFNTKYLKAQDAELAYRARKNGYTLGFDMRSKVKHFHPHRLINYLATQRDQGYWRMFLFRTYPNRIKGDSYSGISDYAQPPLALLSSACLPLSLFMPEFGSLLFASFGFLLACQLPMARLITTRIGITRGAGFVFMSTLRSYARALGMVRGALAAYIESIEKANASI